MPLLICYDISDNYLRQKIAQNLLEVGFERINRSVFCGSPKEKVWKKCQPLLQQLMSSPRACADDSLIVLPIHSHHLYEMVVIGRHDWEPEDLSGDVHTLII